MSQCHYDKRILTWSCSTGVVGIVCGLTPENVIDRFLSVSVYVHVDPQYVLSVEVFQIPVLPFSCFPTHQESFFATPSELLGIDCTNLWNPAGGMWPFFFKIFFDVYV